MSHLVLQAFWLGGISASAICLIFQIIYYIQYPCSRRSMFHKILTQLSVVRLSNILLEYSILNLNIAESKIILHAVYTLYISTDAAFFALLLVFAKNIYDEVSLSKKKINLAFVSVIISILALYIGVFSCLSLAWDLQYKTGYFKQYYYVYTFAKFTTIFVNIIITVLSLTKSLCHSKVLLLCHFTLLTLVQGLVIDITAIVFDTVFVSSVSSAINAHQIIVFTALFVLGNKCRKLSELSEKTISYDNLYIAIGQESKGGIV